MVQSILLATCLTVLSACSGSGHTKKIVQADTLLLYQKNTVVTVTGSPAVVQCAFNKPIPATNDPAKFSTTLVLQQVELASSPEGVYELYITGQPPETAALTSTQPGFVTVLDLYSITAPGAKQDIEIDISAILNGLWSQKKTLTELFATIKFDPIRQPGGTFSTVAGILRISGIKIVCSN